MDTGPGGTFYRYLEDAERALDLACEQLTVQGALYSTACNCARLPSGQRIAEIWPVGGPAMFRHALPLREELRQHNALSSAISALLGQIRKRGCVALVARHRKLVASSLAQRAGLQAATGR
jgi:hypothetical protein